MRSFEVTVGKESLGFSAAHFITYGDGCCERLHGHNYRVGVRIAGRTDEHGLVHDFVDVRQRVDRLLGELDHRTLLPESNPRFELSRAGGSVRLRHEEREYRFPSDDVVVLPLHNTSTEMLASHLADRLLEELRREEAAGGIRSLAVEVEESPGQSATCRLALQDPP